MAFLVRPTRWSAHGKPRFSAHRAHSRAGFIRHTSKATRRPTSRITAIPIRLCFCMQAAHYPLWQEHRLMIYGKGGPYGKLSKRRVIPLSPRVQPLLEGHLSLHDNIRARCANYPACGQRRCQPSTHPPNRHSSCTAPHLRRDLRAKKGISTRALQEIMGHDRLATTEIYLNLSPEEVIREFYGKW